jgi:hypothetical protein
MREEDLPDELGKEVALEVAVRDRVRIVGASLPREHVDAVVFTATARIVARRIDGRFDRAICGDARRELCVRAYSESMLERPLGADASVCAGPVTLEHVEEAGGVGWTPASQTIALEAWRHLCATQGARGGATTSRRRPGP